MADHKLDFDIAAAVNEVLRGTEPLPEAIDVTAEYFRSRLDNVDGNAEYLVLLHHRDRGLLEIFGNVKSKRTTLRMAIEALHMLSQQWSDEEE
jgi:hypothetical protein